MFEIGFGEVMVCLLVAVLVLKPADMVKVATQAGQALAKIKRTWANLQKDITSPIRPINHDHDE